MASPEAQIPVGFRFHPTEEELVNHYLKRKLAGDESVNDTIAEVDVCKVEPWDLPALSKVKSDDLEWFYFSPRGLKYTNSNRLNRKTMGGYWKPTGKDRKIKTRGTNNVIGIKKNLTFYEGRVSRAVKTNWVIHEYHADTSRDFQKTFVLCRLIKKIGKKIEGKDALINDQEKQGNPMASDYENQALSDGVSNVYSSSDVGMNSTLQEAEYDSTSIQQESFFQYASVANVYHGSTDSSNKFPFETTEEEPGYPMASDYENQALSDGVSNMYSTLYVDMDSISQEVEYDSMSIQQGPSFRYASGPNHLNKDSSNKFSFETTEEEDNIEEFLNSVFVNEDSFFSEERSKHLPLILSHQSYQD